MNDPDPKTITVGKYIHTKTGKLYEVVGVALHSETSEQLVVYKPLYTAEFEFFVRPYEMFIGKVEIAGTLQPRFQKVTD